MSDFKYGKQLNGTRDFVRGERFIFKTPACKCEVMQVPQGDEQKKEYFDLLVITEDPDLRKEHLYVYAPQYNGMVGYDAERDELRLDVTPLDEFLSLQYKNKQWSKKMAKYIEKYGFFWPVNYFKYMENKRITIQSDELFRYIQPLCKLHELLENLAIADTSARHLINYDQIFELTFFYLFYRRTGFMGYLADGDPLGIEPHNGNSFTVTWWDDVSSRFLYEELEDENFEEEIKSKNPLPKPNINCKAAYCSTTNSRRVAEIIKRLSQSEGLASESEIRDTNKKDYSYDISYVIWYFYRHITLERKEAREVIDFLFNFIRKVGEIKYLDKNGNIEIKTSLKYNIKFDDSMKEDLLKLARKVCKTELDWGMKNIHPIYDIEEKRPDWKIPDLYSALYFAHFYCDSQYYIRRKCQSPSCDKYFLVRRTNAKKKYCDTCKGNVQKINKRQEKLRRE